ncbi:hypothetical protein ACEW7V_03370 [Areca yellow leaf disease phytoplasma]|uniref:hypothetical protein n=1 Tax=Areca yellow leaf disease phytoplasma TaxID=927614 RepID=UPI0035B5365A
MLLVAADIPSTLAAISNLTKKRDFYSKNGRSFGKNGKISKLLHATKQALTEGKPQVTDVYVAPEISEEKYHKY